MSNKLEGGLIAGSVDISIPVILRATADNTGVTGKAYGDATGSYWRQGGIRVDIPCVTLAAVNSAHDDGGFKEVDSTNMPGSYRFDIPDAAAAVGADWVVIAIKVAGAYIFYQLFYLTASMDLGTEIADIPTTAEFEARTLPSADYVVVGDTLARVTLVDTVSANTDMVTEPPTVAQIQAEMEENGASVLDEIRDDLANGTDGLGALKTLLDACSTHDAAAVKTAIEAGGSSLALIKAVTDALTSASAAKLALSAGVIVTGSAAGGTLSTTQMTTDLSEATDDHYNGRVIIWTGGVLVDQATDITDYDGTTKMLTFTAVTEAPTATDAFIIV